MEKEELLKNLGLETFIAFDFETTGLDPKKDKITEFAAIKFHCGKPIDKLQTLVNPEIPIPFEITRITGISDEMVKNAPKDREISSKIFDFIKNHPIVAHNLPFDIAFLNVLSNREFSQNVQNIGFDTVPLSQAFFFFLPNHKLSTIGEYLGINSDNAHRALNDTEILGQIFLNLVYEISSYPKEVIEKILLLTNDRHFYNINLFKNIFRQQNILGNDSNNLIDSNIDKEFPSPIFISNGSNSSPEFSPSKFFSDNGLLNTSLNKENYEKRESQIQYAEFIRNIFSEGQIGIIEAGTGLGKTLAYLLVALEKCFLENNEHVILSCNTKTLQDQLFQHEIPKLSSALNTNFSATIIKGHKNYICRTRVNKIIESSDITLSDYDIQSIIVIIVWLQWTRSGDFEECPGFLKRRSLRIKEMIQNEPGFCTSKICNSTSGCYLGPLRTATQKADLIVVNHSLLLYELDEQNILPSLNYIILDEAHNIMQSGYNHYRITLNNQIIHDKLSPFCNSTFNNRNSKNIISLSKNSPEVSNSINLLINSIQDIIDRSDYFFNKLVKLEQNKYSVDKRYNQVFRINNINEHLKNADTELQSLKDSINLSLNKIKDLKTFVTDSRIDFTEIENSFKIERISKSLQEINNSLIGITGKHMDDYAYWEAGTFNRKNIELSLNSVPIDIGPLLKSNIFDPAKSVIATSATLSIDSNFNYFLKRFGLLDYEKKPINCKEFGSPFFYPDQCNYYQWSGTISPNDGNYSEFISNSIETIFYKLEKRMLVLFTSQSLLKECYDRLNFSEVGKIASIFPQVSNSSRLSLIKQFRRTNSGILLGTNSFWEGIDLPGDLLKILVITKIPFDVPTDPIIQSYNDKLQKSGGNPFMENSVPSAAIKLRQGFGRLIRSINDDGIYFNLDNRVITKRYGKIFETVIPTPMKKFSSLKDLTFN
tara:strand:+ start:5327 stop:8137 length:2811 start_codon:yes stop_codon:yes gene_type:complete